MKTSSIVLFIALIIPVFAKQTDLSNLYTKSIHERLRIVQNRAHLTTQETELLEKAATPWADHMIENAISTLPVPLGIAPHFVINGTPHLIPMATEEPSVIAAASHAAKLAQVAGGFTYTTSEQIMIGQIQCSGAIDDTVVARATTQLALHKKELLDLANQCDPVLIQHGGGAQELQIRFIQTIRKPMLIIHLLVNVQDAMGANIVNTMLETIAPQIEKIIPIQCAIKIVSNLALYRLAKADAVWKKELIGTKIIEKILDAQAFALADPFRCATHNKGIMNGIDAVALATGFAA